MKDIPREIDWLYRSKFGKYFNIALVFSLFIVGCILSMMGCIFLCIELLPLLRSAFPKLCLGNLPLCIILLGYGIFHISISYCGIASLYAKYTISEEGLLAKYPLQKIQIIPWDEFQQICIGFGGYNRCRIPLIPLIYCVKKGEKGNIYGRWNTDNPFRYRRVIKIYYTSELCTELEKACCRKIPDLRKTPNYKYQ